MKTFDLIGKLFAAQRVWEMFSFAHLEGKVRGDYLMFLRALVQAQYPDLVPEQQEEIAEMVHSAFLKHGYAERYTLR